MTTIIAGEGVKDVAEANQILASKCREDKEEVKKEKMNGPFFKMREIQSGNLNKFHRATISDHKGSIEISKKQEKIFALFKTVIEGKNSEGTKYEVL